MYYNLSFWLLCLPFKSYPKQTDNRDKETRWSYKEEINKQIRSKLNDNLINYNCKHGHGLGATH